MSVIAEILKAYPADCQPTAVEALGNSSGLSGAQFWRLVAPRGALGLRCWPIEHPSPERLALIHDVLTHAFRRGADFLPVPLATKKGESFVEHAGRLWELTPWLPGEVNCDSIPTIERLRAALVALAKFHLAVSDFPGVSQVAPAPAVTQRLARLRALQSGGAATIVDSIDSNVWPELTASARQFAGQLSRFVDSAIARMRPLANVPMSLQICIRDVWSDNLLFTGDAVTGLVDFGAVDIDTPATDIARLLGSLVGTDRSRWQAGLAAYATVRKIPEEESQAIPALDLAGTILGACNWLRWIYVEHRAFESRERVMRRFCSLAAHANSIAGS